MYCADVRLIIKVAFRSYKGMCFYHILSLARCNIFVFGIIIPTGNTFMAFAKGSRVCSNDGKSTTATTTVRNNAHPDGA